MGMWGGGKASGWKPESGLAWPALEEEKTTRPTLRKNVESDTASKRAAKKKPKKLKIHRLKEPVRKLRDPGVKKLENTQRGIWGTCREGCGHRDEVPSWSIK